MVSPESRAAAVGTGSVTPAREMAVLVVRLLVAADARLVATVKEALVVCLAGAVAGTRPPGCQEAKAVSAA